MSLLLNDSYLMLTVSGINMEGLNTQSNYILLMVM